MKQKPEIIRLPNGGKSWSHTFAAFRALAYVPQADEKAQAVN